MRQVIHYNKPKQTPSSPDIESLSEIIPDDFAEAIRLVGIDFTPAFVHGVLTAYCCTDSNPNGWVKTLIETIDPNNATLTEQLRYLNQVKNLIGEQLADSELGFQLLLHNTAETLHDEVLLTREWASGFLLGCEALDLADVVGDDELSLEFIDDLQQITAMPLPEEDDLDNASIADSYQDNYDSDADEAPYQGMGDDTRNDILQIQEYCRGGAMSVFLTAWKK